MKPNPSVPAAEPARAPAKRGRPKGGAAPAALGEGASAEAKRVAAAVLEVLAGARAPTAAADALGVSLPRYYVLELRALHGMLVACEPRAVGRTVAAESALAALRRECDQLRRECARQQALVRAAQRAIGLPPPAPPARPAPAGGKKRRSRRPTARALRAAARLTDESPPAAPVTPGAAVNV
jgi:hypothetical protein